MLTEQSLINPNFIGRDSFRWFTGIVTKYKNTEHGYRAKVRIIGHHPDTPDVPDEVLPWAHVLVPLNLGSGEGGVGVSFNNRGSETVVGFFLDGPDGQQPVIIGALFSDAGIEHPNSPSQGTTGMKLFKPEKQILNAYNKPDGKSGSKPPDSGIPLVNGNAPDGSKSQGQARNEQGTATVVTTVPQCKEGTDTVSKISKALRKFIYYMNTVQNYINLYVNPTLNYIENIPQLINEVAGAVSDGLQSYTKIARDFIIEKLYNILKGLIEKILPKDAVLAAKIATDKAVDAIWCLFQNILKKIFKFAFDFLSQMFGKVVSIPICAIESMIGSMMQTIGNEIEQAIGPVLEEFANTVGGAIGEISGYISQGITYAKTILSFFTCEDNQCNQAYDYEMNKGYVPKGAVNFQKILNYSPAQGVRNLFSDGEKQFADWLGQNSGGNLDPEVLALLGPGFSQEDFASNFDCDGTTLNCGLPKVTFFGGFGGSGGSGSAVVDVLGQVLGVNITDPGSGYTEKPYVTFEDACNIGGGARGNVILNSDGGIDSVYMTGNGYEYIGPDGEACVTNPVGDDGFEYTAYVSSVIILNTGIGYNENDLIYNIYCDSGVEIYPVVDPDGRIVDTRIVNPGIIRTVPELAINTEVSNGSGDLNNGSGGAGGAGGTGAVLVPVLKFVRVGELPENRRPLQQVILCAEPTLVGYVNGKPYYGSFHIHMGRKMTGATHTGKGQYIYDNEEESLASIATPVTQVSTQTSSSQQTTTPTVSTSSVSTPAPTPAPTPTLTPTPTITPTPTPSPDTGSGGSGGSGGGGGYGY
jgi:hypothetical protein